jgi:hypothetical protein
LSIEDVGEPEAESRVSGMMVVGSCFVLFFGFFFVVEGRGREVELEVWYTSHGLEGLKEC